ncbi:MAG: sigma-54 dependent transcriptional regulator [bacterium]
MAVDTTPDIPVNRRHGAILVVDDENSARQVLCQLLRDDGHEVQEASDGFKALGVLKDWTPDIILTDLKMPLMDGISLIKKSRELYPEITCIVMTAFASVETAVQAMKSGANDYLTKPLNFDAVELVIQRSLERIEMVRELQDLREHVQKSASSKIIGNAAPTQQMLALIDQVAPSRATILITGESGTGKEMVARRVHDRSPRAKKPFMTIHCAALPETLLESELFGHEKGSFTGANAMRRGRFEDADGGTLFLDEIGEISPSTQVKLLRFLQTREFERVGGNQTHTVDVRIVAATNRNLEEEVRAGRFREDLYYRLNVINVESPPLRTRRSDIPVLTRFFVDRYGRENQKTIREIDPEVVHILESYDWPGNVRELENVIERAVVLAEADVIGPQHLPTTLSRKTRGDAAVLGRCKDSGLDLEDLERLAILATYEATGGDTRETSRILDISQRKIQYKLRDYRDSGYLR